MYLFNGLNFNVTIEKLIIKARKKNLVKLVKCQCFDRQVCEILVYLQNEQILHMYP